MNTRLQLVVIWASLFALQAEAMAQQPRAIRIPSEATPDAPQPCLFWAPNVPQGESRPLLVNLHTWSSDFSQDRSPWWQQAVSRGWFLIQPNFQGRNDRPEAGGSELARLQILEARDWVIENYPVDTERVYLAGVSGGGHMTMLMSGYHPDQFSAASAWCGPSNLADWYVFHTRNGVEETYAQMIAACCGGPPGTSNEVDEQYHSRSPIHHLQHVGDLHLDINTGVLDGKTGSIPIHHSLRAYNVVAEANGDPLIAETEMDYLWNNTVLANPQPSDLAGDREYRNPVLLRRESGNTRITVFDGTHEAFPETACEWLSRQRRQVTLPGEESVTDESSATGSCDDAAGDAPLHLHWEDNFLTISGEHLPGGEIQVNYLEAYCRDRSTDADWGGHTYIGHQTELLEASEDGTFIKLQCHVADGLVVDHEIRSTHDEVDFRIHAHNPTDQRSEAHWAQPCIRLARFTGADQESYLAKSFVFLDGELAMMPTRDWATEARYTPGQVWAAPGVDRRDVNPRPLHPDVPSNGLIGCFSADDSTIFATAFEPYQELFQGVIVCLHSDFRLGGLEPGASLEVRGKIYIVPNDVDALLERYEADFPEHVAAEAAYAPIRELDEEYNRSIAAWKAIGATHGSLDWDGEFVPELLMCENACFQFDPDFALGDVPAYEYGPGFGIAMHVGTGTTEAVRRCASLEGLIELKLEGGELTQKTIASLSVLSDLQELYLVRSRLPENALEQLLQLTLLRVLSLRESSIDDAGVEQIGEFTELRFLNLDDTIVSDTCLDEISQLPTLYRLSLCGTHISDAGMATISGIESLTWLHLARTAVTDDGIAHLSRLRLNTLDLSQTQVTDAGLEHLAGMDNLRNLHLSGLPLSGEGLAFLAPLDRLWSLRLDDTTISDQSLQHLAELSSLGWLDLSETSISDAGLPHLVSLTTLKHLDLTGSQVTADAVERLRRTLPNCDIEYGE